MCGERLRSLGLLCSLQQQQGPRERHGAGSGQGQLGAREKFCTRGWWAWPHAARVQEISQTWDLNFGWSCVEPGAGLDDPCESLSTQDILWYCECQDLYFDSRVSQTEPVQPLLLCVVLEVSCAMRDISRGSLEVGATGETPSTAIYSCLILLGTLRPSLV